MKRGKIDVMKNILDSIKGPTRKTKIMYKANLSYRMVNAYLGLMSSIGLIILEKNGGNYTSYNITPKGQKFLTKYSELKQLYSLD